MSGDQELIDAYRHNQDIHRSTASKVFHTPFDEVTDLQRRNAKAVNFGIVYGISSFGLSQDLNVSKKEAQAYIDQYFADVSGSQGIHRFSGCNSKRKGICRYNVWQKKTGTGTWLRIILCSVRLENELQ